MAKDFAVELLRTSALCFSGFDKSALKYKTQMVLNGVQNRKSCGQLLFPNKGTALDKAILEAPSMPGVLVWPYQNSNWAVETRLGRLINHYSVVDKLDQRYAVTGDQKLRLLDLSEFFPGLSAILDQPIWFLREGGFSLNLFVGHFRAFSIVFSLFEGEGGQREIYVGGIQGRSNEGVLDLYRSITRALFGIRPRDMAIELLRMVASHWNIERILCVADECRHHRHPFFGETNFQANYNDIWKDRGGRKIDDSSYEIPVYRIERDLSDIASKKRSMYKKRYQFLRSLEKAASDGFPNARLVNFLAD